MLEVREEVEHEILWEMNRGSTNVWHENWTGLGSLHHVMFPINEELQEVADLRAWWNAKCCPKLKPLFQAAPAVIAWELWKRRNTMKNGGAVSCNWVIHEVNKTLHYLARVRCPWLSKIPLLWPEMISFFDSYKPYVVTKRVTRQLPYEGWFKCNTDGASRGNPGPISYGFCV